MSIYDTTALYEALKKVIHNLPGEGVQSITLRLAVNKLPTVTVKQIPASYAHVEAPLPVEVKKFVVVDRAELNSMWVLLEEVTSAISASDQTSHAETYRKDLVQRARNCLARNAPT